MEGLIVKLIIMNRKGMIEVIKKFKSFEENS